MSFTQSVGDTANKSRKDQYHWSFKSGESWLHLRAIATVSFVIDLFFKNRGALSLLAIENLRKEIIELQDKLGLNSKIHLYHHRKMYIVKRQKRRAAGGQPGHEAHKRELMKADEVVKCSIDTICVCGGQRSPAKR